MSYLVLARKWRPQTFEDIAGQGHVARTLQNAIRANRIAHAYLFTGVRGVGKTTAARILAKALNCEQGPTAIPCNQCSQCKEITAGSAIDVLEIDGASNRGIDEIRQIVENVRYQPAKCRFKIYIIDEVHQVTRDAFNALLKTLEEPPPSVKFILATTEPHRLPDTILSRCQRYDFRRIALREIVKRLKMIAESEDVKVTEAALIALAREADGSMRDAQSLLEQVLASSGPGETVDEALLVDMLGLAERQMLYAISQAVIAGDAKSCVERIAEAAAQGRDLERLSHDLLEHFRNLLVMSLSRGRGNPSVPALDLPDQEIGDLADQIKDVSVDMLLDYFDFMAVGDEGVARAANPRFALEATLVRLATLPKTLPVAQLLERLEKLEGKIPGAPKFAPSVPASTPPQGTKIPAPPAVPAAAAKAEASSGALNATPAISDAGAKDWPEFVKFVGRQKKVLATHLESVSPLDLSAGELELSVGERHQFNYLQDTENLMALKALAKQFFARDLTIKLAAVEKAAPAEPYAEAVDGGAGRSDMVKEALRIFGGSVRSGRREGR